MSIAAVLLAAGQSRRMGAVKLVQVRDGLSLAAHALRPLLEIPLTQIVVVVGAESAVAEALPRDARMRIVLNVAPERGLASSLALGVAALMPQIDAAFIVLADMPKVVPETYRRLIAARQTEDLAVVPAYAGRRCNPVLLCARGFALVEQLQGDRGLRALLVGASGVRELPVDDPGVAIDIDTPNDLERWTHS